MVITSADGGATWTTQPLPSGIGVLYTVNCTSTADCLAGGGVTDPETTLPVGNVLKTTNGGATWTSVPLPAGTGVVTAISCGSLSECVGLTYSKVDLATYPAPTALISTDGGATWSNGSLPSGLGSLADVSCVAADCTAVGYALAGPTGVIMDSSDAGRTWQLQAAGYQYILGVSCTDPESCEAVGEGWGGISVILGVTPVPPTVTGVSPTFGPVAGGTSVTITGTGFTGATGVLFGTKPATSFSVVSDTTITAISPAASAGLRNIFVTAAGGTSAIVAADHFTYIAPKPTVTGVSPTSGPRAGGTSVTITGTGFTRATKVTFGGVVATSFSVVSAAKITAVSPAGSVGVKNILVTTPGGTSAMVAADHFTYTASAG
jgi:hypothetical protein